MGGDRPPSWPGSVRTRLRPSCTPFSADPRQRVADELVHHPPASERRLHQHHPRRLRLHLSDLGGARAAVHAAQRRQRRVRVPPGRRTRRACPRWPRTSGRSRGSPRRPRRPGPPARRPRARTIATPDARASSLSTEATPPRVASRIVRSAGPAASSSASAAGHSERVSDSISASSSNSPRASMIAVPCVADAGRTRGSGRRGAARAGESAARGSSRPIPVVHTYMPSAWPRSTTLVSPATISHAGGGRGRGDRVDLGAQHVGVQALLEDQRRLSASGRAPPIARSLTVPLTASSPIEPPGKRSGLTTKLSVVSASSVPSTSRRRRRPSRPARLDPEGRRRTGPRSASASPCRRRRAPS